MQNTVLFLLSVTFLTNCSTPKKPPESSVNTTKIHVNLDNAKPLHMSNVFSDIHYYYLKSPNNRPIGSIWKLMVQDNYVALYDRSRKSVWIYNLDGKYVNEVKIPVGRGPGELTDINDVIFTKNHNIYALGNFKIVGYKLDNSYLEEVDFHFRLYRFTYDNSTKSFISYASNSINAARSDNEHAGDNLIFLNKEGKITKSVLPIPKERAQISYGIPNNFPTYKGQQLFISHLNDTVYTIEAKKAIPKYILDYGEHAIPKGVFKLRKKYSKNIHHWTNFMKKEITDKGYVTYLSYFNETDSYIYFRIGTGKKSFNVLYNKTSKKTSITPDKMINDIDFGVTSYMYEAHGNALYTVIGANKLVNHLNVLYNNHPDKYQDPRTRGLIKLANSIDANRNPILMVATFKDSDKHEISQ
ncbi:MAG: 6-bladed beta-propeller [Balneolaceae bacterium]